MLSTAGIGVLVYALIQAPVAGWASAQTLGLAAVVLTIGAAFVTVERRRSQPMLDLRLFGDARFAAASATITIAFFALAGFIFLITQYFHFVRGYGPLDTGVRLLPVAASVAAGSIVGTLLAVRHGTKVVVTSGLLSLTAAYTWISATGAGTTYTEIVGQMLLLGSGMGLTSAPATESIMGAVTRGKAGIGSAMNDATRELGGTLGVAVIGSVYASLYAHALRGPELGGVPVAAVTSARDSIGAALLTADRLGDPAGATLSNAAVEGFFDGLQTGCLVAAGVCATGALLAMIALPSQPTTAHPSRAGIAGQPLSDPGA